MDHRVEHIREDGASDGQNDQLNLLAITGSEPLNAVRDASPRPAGEDAPSTRQASDDDEKPENIPLQENRNEPISVERPPEPIRLPELSIYDPSDDDGEPANPMITQLIRELRDIRQALVDRMNEEARQAWENNPPTYYEPTPERDPNANPWERRRARARQ